MKTFAIKTNNSLIIEYLLDKIEKVNLEKIYFSCKRFKIYKNVIIHYKGDKDKEFIKELVNIICNVILEFYKENIINKIINYNYFYFDDYEQNIIKQNCYEIINSSEYEQKENEEEQIYEAVYKYLSENKKMILEGFVNFRLKKYNQYIDNIIDMAVNKFIIEKEYKEFISLLKIYVDSKPSCTDLVYLIYLNSESTILDKNKNVISMQKNLQNAKYLSDISFSSNDLALNTLLSILPERIEIHVLDEEDEFIKTLKLIFENRIQINKRTV